MRVANRPLIVAATVLLAMVSRAGSTEAGTAAGDAALLMREGAAAFHQRDYAAAERDWRAAAERYGIAGDVDGQLDALVNLEAVWQRVGDYHQAVAALRNAEGLAEKHLRDRRMARIENALGVALTFRRDYVGAELALRAAKSYAEAGPEDLRLLAGIHLNLANLFAASAAATRAGTARDALYNQAFDEYALAASLAGRSNDSALQAQTAVNTAFSVMRAERYDDDADRANTRALAALRDLPDDDGGGKVEMLITVGRTDESRVRWLIQAQSGTAEVDRVSRRAFDAYELARDVATRLNDPVACSYALGYEGTLYEILGRVDEAQTLTRRAIQLAQEGRAPDSLYLWHWQAARLFKARGDHRCAMAAYARAREAVEAVRGDLALGFGNYGAIGSFRSQVGPLYAESADLLLGEPPSTPAAAQHGDVELARIDEAIEVVEKLRVAEVQSYFRDPCFNQNPQTRPTAKAQFAQLVGPGRGDSHPAVIYPIPLEKRLEIIVVTPQGMHRCTPPDVGSKELFDTVRKFRRAVTDPDEEEDAYREHGHNLYRWLLEPVRQQLRDEKVDTLVFVPDGPLRTLAWAALPCPDGHPLIDKCALVVSPGLTVGPREQYVHAPGPRYVLAAGSSGAAEGEPGSLPTVPMELWTIWKMFGWNYARTLVESDFTVEKFAAALRRPDRVYSIVHIASHCELSGEGGEAFIQTHGDGRLELRELATELRRLQVLGRPLDLLTLSACRTSAGDEESVLERASLGLGALAVKAGARSALASLWSVNDQATGELMRRFYAELLRAEAGGEEGDRALPLGKAQALRRAQKSLIHDKDGAFTQPRYWAGFILIGDWM